MCVCEFVWLWGEDGGGGRPTIFNNLPPPLLCKLNVMNQSSLCWELCCIIAIRFNDTVTIP